MTDPNQKKNNYLKNLQEGTRRVGPFLALWVDPVEGTGEGDGFADVV
jgi:hypothetical protein